MTTTIFLAAGIEVHSDGECPSGAAVASKLAPLLADGGEQGGVAYLEVEAGLDGESSAHLRLLRPEGSVVGDRRLALQGDCAAKADTVATVLATWATPPAAIAVAPPVSTVPIAPLADAPAPAHAWLGASAGIALVGGLAGTGQIDLVAARADSNLRARVAVITQTTRDHALDSHQVSWRRTHGELGLGWQSRGQEGRSFWQLSIDADALLGWLSASGRDFFENHRQDAFEYGVGTGLRAERKRDRWAFWLEARGSLWARGQRAVLSNSADAWNLPQFDVVATVGVSRLAFPWNLAARSEQ